ncbi:hypothetical protein KCU81_g9336, partial [Aureobasidium melanogenum]|uniref:Uncharacterized protein n=1 Tax=Aureobasidium melanogenum (strain CBS 110374) TaxID=1043003 RepID=A0A074VBZ5_AURM1
MADRVLYIDPTLRQMRDALENDGLGALLKCIMEETHGIGSEADATMLLAQVAPNMLRSILLNSLPVDVATGRVVLQPWEKISFRSQYEDELEPGIYINILAPRDGSPLSLDELSRFLEGLEAASYHRFHSGSSEELLCAIRGSNLVQDLNEFLGINKFRLEHARAQNATHMAILPHCDSARNIHSACKEHYKFKVPALLSLARCVLGALFPDKQFRLFNYCLFRAFTASHLTIGQSIGLQLTGSNGRYGGFNFTAHEDPGAAETEAEIKREPEITESEWMTVRDRDITLLDKFDPLLAESCRHRRFGVLMQLRVAVQAFDEKLEDDIKQLELARLEHHQKSYAVHHTANYRQQPETLDQEMIAHQALKLLTTEEGEKIDRALDNLSSQFTEAGCEAEMQRLTGGLFPGRPSL